MTSQGHPRAIFSRAIENGNLVAAESSAREVGRLTLEEALRLLFLYAEKDRSSTNAPPCAGSPATSREARTSHS